MPFDVRAALAAGYSPDEVVTFLGEHPDVTPFRTKNALADGHTPREIADYLTSTHIIDFVRTEAPNSETVFGWGVLGLMVLLGVVIVIQQRWVARARRDRANRDVARASVTALVPLVRAFAEANRDALYEGGPEVILRSLREAASPNLVLTDGIPGEGLEALREIGLHPDDLAMLEGAFKQLAILADPRTLNATLRDAAAAAEMQRAGGMNVSKTRAALEGAISHPRDPLEAQALLMGMVKDPASGEWTNATPAYPA